VDAINLNSIERTAKMAFAKLQEQVYQKLEKLSDHQLCQVLLSVDFLTIREDQEFIEYVNKRTQQTLNAKKRGRKFYRLEELQCEFSSNSLFVIYLRAKGRRR